MSPTGLAQLLGLPAGWHGHIEDTASTSTLAALIAARHASRAGASSSARSTRTRRSRRPPGCSAWSCARCRPTTSSGCGPTRSTSTTRAPSSPPSGRPRRRRSTRCRDRRRCAATRASGSTSTRPTPARRWSAPSCAGRSRASSTPTRSSSTRTSGCSRRWTARCSGRAGRSTSAPRSRSCPSTCVRRDEVDSLSEYGPALGRRFRALKLWAVLRCVGRAGLQAMIREHVRLAELFESWVRDEPGWELCAPRPFSVVCFRREGSDEENERLLERGQRERRDLHLAHEARRPLRAAARDRQREDDRGRRSQGMGRHPPRGRCALARRRRAAANCHEIGTPVARSPPRSRARIQAGGGSRGVPLPCWGGVRKGALSRVAAAGGDVAGQDPSRADSAASWRATR